MDNYILNRIIVDSFGDISHEEKMKIYEQLGYESDDYFDEQIPHSLRS